MRDIKARREWVSTMPTNVPSNVRDELIAWSFKPILDMCKNALPKFGNDKATDYDRRAARNDAVQKGKLNGPLIDPYSGEAYL